MIVINSFRICHYFLYIPYLLIYLLSYLFSYLSAPLFMCETMRDDQVPLDREYEVYESYRDIVMVCDTSLSIHNSS